MNYRIKFKKATKKSKIKDFINKISNKIKSFSQTQFNNAKLNIQKVKQFLNKDTFNRLGIFILFLIPIFICLILCFYSLIWIVTMFANIFGNSWKQLLDIMPISLGSVLLNIIIVITSIKCMCMVITSATEHLNADLNSIKSYLVNCICPICINAVIYFILLYRPAYNWTCTILSWGFIILAIFFVLGLLGKIFSHEQEYDVIQLIIPRK